MKKSGSRDPATRALFLHGLPGDSHDWRPVAERVARMGIEPIVPDRPGWGTSREPGRDLAGNTEAALAALDRATSSRALVIGHSWGTLVALDLAERHPERVDALCLVAPFGPGSQERIGTLFTTPRTARPLIAMQLAVSAAAQRAPLLGPLIGRRFNLPAEARAQRGRHWPSATARRAFLVERREVGARLGRLLARAASIDSPALVVVGARDRTTGTGPARRVATLIPGARFRVVAGAGHALPLTHPDRVAAEVGAFLEEALPLRPTRRSPA